MALVVLDERGQGRKSDVERECRAQAEEERRRHQEEERTVCEARERERANQTRKEIEYAYERNRELAAKVYEEAMSAQEQEGCRRI